MKMNKWIALGSMWCAVIMLLVGAPIAAYAHTNAAGFSISPGSTSSVFDVNIYYGTYHTGVTAPEGAVDLRDGGNLVDTKPFALVPGYTNVADGTVPPDLTFGKNYFFVDNSNGLTGPAGSQQVYSFQSATFEDLSPGDYDFGYNPLSSFTATWDPSLSAAVNNGAFGFDSSGKLTSVAGANQGPPDIDGAKSSYSIDDLSNGNVNPVFDGGTLAVSNSGKVASAFTVKSTDGTIDTQGNAVSFDGVLSGPGAIRKTGAGMLALTASNSYAGGTTLDAGTLSVSADDNLGDPSGDLTLNGGTLKVTGTSYQSTERSVALGSNGGGFNIANADNVFTVAQALGGNGGLTKLGDGTLVLTGANSYTGGTTVDEGTLQGNTAGLQGDITDNAALVFDQADDSGTYAGVISGNGALTKTGSGSVTLTGANTYGGGTTVKSGALKLSKSGALGDASGALTVNSGTLDLGGTTQTQNGGLTLIGGTIENGTLDSSGAFNPQSGTIGATLSGAGALTKTSTGTLTLNAVNTYTGGTTISDGTLQISADANLGDAGGALVFDGGRLASTASRDTSRSVALNADGRFDVADGTTLGLAGDLTGAGNVVKTGSGVLRLTGTNAYGDTQIASGQLEGNATAISGNVANAGTVVFDQADDATFAGDIAGLYGKAGTVTKRGAGDLTLSGDSALDWSLKQGGVISTTDRFGGDLNIASGARMTFDQVAAGAYAGTLTGSGDVLLTGGGTVQLTGDSSGFAGTSTVRNSTLVVNQSLGGALEVADGGRLQGNGTAGDTTVASDGTVAPGNSIGTLHVDGDVTFAKGSHYQVEVDPAGTDSDRIIATGTATLNGGSVEHIGADGRYDPISTYTILSAEQGVNGTFDRVSSDFAFLDPILGYGANDVTLQLVRNDIDFVDEAATDNQRAAATGAAGLTFGNAVYNSVVQLDAPAARRAFDALSGEIHASAKTALIEASRRVRNAMIDRMHTAQASGPTSDMTAPADSAETAVAADGSASWGRVIGAWGDTDSDGNAGDVDRSTRGVLVGADTPVTEHGRIGLMTGYTRTEFSADERDASGDSDDFHLGAYGGAEYGPVGLRLGAAYSWHDIDTNRTAAFTGFQNNLQDTHHAGTAQAFAEAGYGIDVGTTELEPFAGVAYVNLDNDGFTERGGDAALRVRGDNTDTTFTTVGLRAAHTVALGGTTAALRGSVGWRHGFGDITPDSTQSFAGSDAFTVTGVPIAKDSAVVDASVGVSIAENTTLGLSYGGLFGSDTQDNSGRLDLAVRF